MASNLIFRGAVGAFLVALETRERERSGIANLKVEYNKVHGFYIEVTNANAARVPDDYRRRQTLKNAERYITPELKTFEDKALSANERALAREKFLYEQLLDQSSEKRREDLEIHIPAGPRLGKRATTRPSKSWYTKIASRISCL